jgi:hypothetical protein
MSLKILADTSIVYNSDEVLYQYISSIKLINAEQGFTNDTKIEITLITSRKQNELTDGTIYNSIVDWLIQKPKTSLDNFIDINTMDYTLDEIEHPLDNPYQMIIKNNELHLTYKQIVPPRKLIETPLPQTGLTLHYGDLTFFANLQNNQMTITPPNGMSCQQLTGQDNCSFSNSNKPKKLKILGPTPNPPTQINVDSDKKKETSSGMSKNELYAIIFGSIGGVLLIGLILYFDLRSRKKSNKKKKLINH